MFTCFSTLGCPDATLDEAIALAQRHGIPALELRALEGTVDLAGHFARTCGTPAEFAARLEASGLRLASLDTSFRLVGAAAKDRESLLALVPWGEAIGGVRLRIFDGGKSLSDDELSVALGELAWWNRQRSEGGWRSDVMIETHDMLASTSALQRFLTAAPAGTAILWDSHHTWRKGGENPVETWRAIRPAVVHLHVKDSISEPSDRHPYTYVLPGEGEFPMVRLMEALRADGFAGPLSLEWERKWHPSLAPLDEALVAAAKNRWW